MAGIRSFLALVAAVGSAGATAGQHDLIDARLRARAALVAAQDAVDHRRPQEVLGMLGTAWDELAHLPGGDAFQDLVVLDAATELARESLERQDAASARLALEAAMQRLRG